MLALSLDLFKSRINSYSPVSLYLFLDDPGKLESAQFELGLLLGNLLGLETLLFWCSIMVEKTLERCRLTAVDMTNQDEVYVILFILLHPNYTKTAMLVFGHNLIDRVHSLYKQ
jgi:hypothetical protein